MLFEVEITQCLAYWHSLSLDKPYFNKLSELYLLQF